jgi:D-tyrosyl-tRNA(Tyr) deacylase
MRVLVQRVLSAHVVVNDTMIASIGRGLLLLVGIRATDTDEELTWMANKCVQLRIFPDEEGKMNKSLLDVGGEALVVSQFTLYGDCRKGNRPSFIEAAPPSFADATYQLFSKMISDRLGKPVPTGEFGADMKVALVNDGPVTIWIDRESVVGSQ